MMPATTPRIATVLVMAVGVLCASASYAGVPSDNWKTECVGRMQINLPGAIDVAAMLPTDLVRTWDGAGDLPYKFSDGQHASWSSSGQLKITHPISPGEKTILEHRFTKRKVGAVEYARNQGAGYVLTDLQKSKYVHLAWRGNDYYQAYFFVDDIAVYWGANTEDIDILAMLEKYYQTLLTGLRPRPLFDVPREPGVCLPYLFVRDDGQTPRHIGMTYRLKAHPDITVWLEDASAERLGERQNPEKLTARYKAAFFWNQDYQNYRSIESQWPLRRTFKDTLLAGLPGVKTFVKLTRDDKERTEDYGYLAAVRGNPDASEDHPDLMLYVIQDSINATKRGVAPLTKKEFIDIAEKIAASVRRRDTADAAR